MDRVMEMATTSSLKLVLASSSPRRQELLRLLQLPFTIVTRDTDESTEPGMSPACIVESLSLRKAEAVRQHLADQGDTDSLIIGSDTIVVLDGQALGKPSGKEDALRMLQALRGREHEVYSGVACVDASRGIAKVKHRVTKVYMKPLRDEQLARYIATGEPMDKAGAYGIQGMGAMLVDKIEGDFFNVVGLPVSLLSEMLLDFGFEVL
ncbi:Maf family protein [Paenibacillus turpanensis]|uniref:Maf family protein n=1 Tax=Paenibacillus turpanensis TaxID=2689078 RepID=UPI001FB67236|nr:Maf family protein [Paenibacillus turpanensis]